MSQNDWTSSSIPHKWPMCSIAFKWFLFITYLTLWLSPCFLTSKRHSKWSLKNARQIMMRYRVSLSLVFPLHFTYISCPLPWTAYLSPLYLSFHFPKISFFSFPEHIAQFLFLEICYRHFPLPGIFFQQTTQGWSIFAISILTSCRISQSLIQLTL